MKTLTLQYPESSHTPNRVLTKNFNDGFYHLEDLYQTYEKAYNIPTLTYKIDLEDQHSFDYCKDRDHIAVILPYGKNKDLLLSEFFFKNKAHWLPIAGSVQSELKEDFMGAAMRMAKTAYPNILLGELEPIALIKNVFSINNKSCVHKGVAFISRIRNSDPQSDIYNNKSIRCQLIRCSVLQSIGNNFKSQRNELIDISKKYIDNRNRHVLQEDEIEGYINKSARYAIHNAITKPLMNFFGRFFFDFSIRDLKNRIEELILEESPKTFIDVACGDNDLVVQIAKKNDFELAVGNDLSWAQLQDLKKGLDDSFKNSNSLVLFTNHDAKSFPFKDGFFDVLLCKNVLHHMNNKVYFDALIRELNRISKKVIIVEVLDPKYTGKWGRFIHKWVYDKLLREVEAGDNFLSREAFNAMCMSGNCVDRFEMKTIRATYQFCIFKNT